MAGLGAAHRLCVMLCPKHVRLLLLGHSLRFPLNSCQYSSQRPYGRGSLCKSQELMMSMGVIASSGSGMYTLMPPATRVMDKLLRMVDDEMNKIGALKIAMPTLGSKELWEKTGRWDVMGKELFQITDRHGIHHCLSPTHEECVTSVIAENRPSHKALPLKYYQTTRKFRDEMRPKHGLLRCREFEMSDLYTFDADEQNAITTYENVCKAYERLVEKLKLDYLKVEGSSGAMGGSLSHEYHLPAEIGEDTLCSCPSCGKVFNKEITEDPSKSYCAAENCPKSFKETNGIEVLHAFLLGEKYSAALGAQYQAQDGTKKNMYMACFGLGVTRLIAASVEVLSTEKEIRWPAFISPYTVCIISQKEGYKSDLTDQMAHELYTRLNEEKNLKGEVQLDARTQWTIGKRLYLARKQGYPWIIIIGKSALKEEPSFEVIDVYNNHTELLSAGQVLEKLRTVETLPLSL